MFLSIVINICEVIDKLSVVSIEILIIVNNIIFKKLHVKQMLIKR